MSQRRGPGEVLRATAFGVLWCAFVIACGAFAHAMWFFVSTGWRLAS